MIPHLFPLPLCSCFNVDEYHELYLCVFRLGQRVVVHSFSAVLCKPRSVPTLVTLPFFYSARQLRRRSTSTIQ